VLVKNEHKEGARLKAHRYWRCATTNNAGLIVADIIPIPQCARLRSSALRSGVTKHKRLSADPCGASGSAASGQSASLRNLIPAQHPQSL